MTNDPNDTNIDWQKALDTLQRSQQAQQAEPPPQPDDTRTYWAMALDLLANNGKNLGGVVQAGGNDYNHRLKEWEDRNSPEKAFQRQYQVALLGDRMRGRGIAEAGQTGVQTRWETKRADVNDPDSQRNATAIKQAYDIAQARKQGGVEAEHEYNPMLAQDRANISGAESAATTDARIKTELGYTPQTNEAAAQKAAAVATAQTDPELDKQRKLNPILADRSTNGVGVGLDPAQFVKDNPNLTFDETQLARALKTRTTGPKFIEQVQSANRAHKITQGLYDSLAAFQAIPSRVASGELTLAQANNLRAELSQQIEGHRTEYAGAMGKIAGSPSQAQIDRDMKSLPSEYNPTALDRMNGVWRTIEANIQGNLGTFGVNALPPAYIGGQGTPPPSAAPRPSPSTATSTFNQQQEAPQSAVDALPQDPMNLGGTSKRGAKNADFAGPGVERSYTLKLPSGRTVKASLNAEQLDSALRNGAELQ